MEEAALAPPAAPPGSLTAALSGRRAHLDSASYRALSRLFSHCLHLHPSRHAGRPDAEVEPAAANSLGDSGEFPQVAGSSQSEDAGLDRRKNLEVDAALGNPAPHETPSPSPLGVPDSSLNPSTDPGIVLQDTLGSGIAGVEQVEDVEEAVLTGSTSVKAGDDGKELGVGAGLKGEDEALRLMNACLDGDVNELVKEMVCNDDGHLLLNAMMTNLSGLIDDASAGTMSAQSCGASVDKLLHDGKIAEEVKELGGGIDDDRYVDNVDHGPIDGGGFEEGEIEGDIQNLFADDSGNSELEDKDANGEKLEEDFVSRRSGDNGSCGHDVHNCYSRLMPQKGNRDLALNTERNSKDDSQMHVARAQTVSYDEVVDWNETPLPGDEVLKHGNKRKRTLTEERKAKKTKNKRIKRAQQREAEGVKRLKLQPVIKPKVAQYCRYYLLGKCQHGSICKFSHDTTPLTKSKPCTHFARDSCLKGDDCPYDHELSKYPCHNFLENGMCIRGDKCKFSHEIQTTEGPSTPDTKKSDVSLVPDKANRREQISSQKGSTIYNGEPVTSAPTKHHSILKNFAGISENAQKASVRIPKGYMSTCLCALNLGLRFTDYCWSVKMGYYSQINAFLFNPQKGHRTQEGHWSIGVASLSWFRKKRRFGMEKLISLFGMEKLMKKPHSRFIVVYKAPFIDKVKQWRFDVSLFMCLQGLLFEAFRASSFFDHHDFAYMCARTMGPSHETSVSLVQCML
ncbi:hypothetical protein GUJ93_ZPchr0008g12858 [Zizania palustris]|uniref:C3H1-type domain-containing protein n=1 Tax=Zizania palustris TaxID=103762 RepID=A0A8J5VEY6_ZIZPA|nr:hypothetical protein GUJ93_ZPchr0008g12858 [Zizania palustris]